MTLENYEYRTSYLFLRNNLIGEGKFQIPVIPKSEFASSEFNNLLLVGFDRTNKSNEELY